MSLCEKSEMIAMQLVTRGIWLALERLMFKSSRTGKCSLREKRKT